MFKLFEQIFHGERRASSGYPEALVTRAIERAVDATDPRVRILSGYAKTLRPAVLHAIEHVVTMVDTLAEPISLVASNHGSDVVLGALFASADSVRNLLQRDQSLQGVVAEPMSPGGPIHALLLATMSQKRVFGHDLVDDNMVSDVALTIISFDEHRLAGPTADRQETDRFLKWRAYDYLLVLALGKVAEVQGRRADLTSHRKLLQSKLNILSRSGGNVLQAPSQTERPELQRQMDAIESELKAMGAQDNVLEQHLHLVRDTLMTADQQLWCESQTLYIDLMHYQREPTHPKAKAVPVQILHDANGRALAVQRVIIPRDTL